MSSLKGFMLLVAAVLAPEAQLVGQGCHRGLLHKVDLADLALHSCWSRSYTVPSIRSSFLPFLPTWWTCREAEQ